MGSDVISKPTSAPEPSPGGTSETAFPPEGTTGGWAGTRGSRPTFGPAAGEEQPAEVARLRQIVRSRDAALDRLLEAVMTLRRGAVALREENRELRTEVECLRRRRR